MKIVSLSNGELEALIINRTNKKRIPIITVHQAKGLEFDIVFISGLKEGVFPSYIAIKNNNLEEEMRTFYVALTRAKKNLYLTYNIEGGYGRQDEVSRFIQYINKECMDNDY